MKGRQDYERAQAELLLLNEFSSNSSITLETFQKAYARATHILPNNNITNLISKANQSPYRVFELFKTQKKVSFNFDDQELKIIREGSCQSFQQEREN